MVAEESALLEIPNETAIPLHSNHCDLGKYGKIDDPNYSHVSHSIRQLMKLTSFNRRPSVGSVPSGPLIERTETLSTNTSSETDSDSSRTDSGTVPSSPIPQSPNLTINRPLEYPSHSMSEERFAAIIKDGNLASIDSAIDFTTNANPGQVSCDVVNI